MPIMLELKAEEMAEKARQAQPATQNLATSFFKAVQAQAQKSTVEAMKKGKVTIYETQLKTVYAKTPATEQEIRRLIEKAQAQQKALQVAKTATSTKPSPEKERVRRTELVTKEVTPSALPSIPEYITLAGYQIKTVYLLVGVAIVIIVALAMK